MERAQVRAPRHLVVARCERREQLADVVGELIDHGVDPRQLAVVGRGPRPGRNGHLGAALVPVVVAAVVGAAFGLLAAGGAVLGALVGTAAAGAALVVQRELTAPCDPVEAEAYELVARAEAVALADRILTGR